MGERTNFLSYVLFIAFFINLVSAETESTNSILFLHFKKSAGEISLKSSSLIPGTIKHRFKNRFGDLEYVVKSMQGDEIISDNIQDPSLLPYDYIDPANPDRLQGGIHILDEADLIVRVPYKKRLGDISFYDRGAAGRRGALLTSFSLEGIEERCRTVMPVQDATIELLQGDSTTDNRVNYVCFSEGYTQSELNSGKFITDLTKGINIQFNEEPYKRYKGHFNVWAVSVASENSGLGGYFNSTANDRLISLGSGGYAKVEELLEQLKPSYDMVLVLIKIPTYGGAGGKFATATIHSSSGDLILHETGHGYADLADEYQTAWSITPREMVNCTEETVRENIKWNVWIDPSTPVPTPEGAGYDETGLFEGCMYQTEDWYRPKDYCKMRVLSSGFCTVCRETIITRAYQSASPVDEYYPDKLSVNYGDLSGKKMVITPLQPADNSIVVTWSVNGTAVSGNSEELDLTQAGLKNGENTIEAIVVDETEWIKIGYNLPVPRDTVTWTVNYDPNGINKTGAEASFSFGITGITVDRDNLNLAFTLPSQQDIAIQLYSVKGILVETLYTGKREMGAWKMQLQCQSDIAGGIYFLSLSVERQSVAKMVQIVK